MTNIPYLQFDFYHPEACTEILLAELEDFPFEGFEEPSQGHLRAFIPQPALASELQNFCQELQEQGWTCEQTLIPPQNWNLSWETAYPPVEVDDFCFIYAPFHTPKAGFAFNLLLSPKMSFGTGHHATTRLMLRLMRQNTWQDTKVLDYGCGTGILAIMAKKLGAASVQALDIEAWACENTIENAQINQVDLEVLAQGGLEQVPPQTRYNRILANINRHIILDSLTTLYQLALPQSQLYLSGFYQRDQTAIQTAAQAAGWQQGPMMTEPDQDWLAWLWFKN